ncbi:carboxypeptidase Y-deficient [Tieghemiomyces parasiticus]|uniref:Carboxypeptidase Y-deficient n=1 Tax=Tieghemiomyces parasiticus TaxID=78921 RepID=A0A9W8A9R9_9FUNG|nr:carboxypeptidase Y-deficient [Tieghemiomyces parasiticus]
MAHHGALYYPQRNGSTAGHPPPNHRPPPPRASQPTRRGQPSPTRTHTAHFLQLRSATTKRVLLEENKLRNRLEKLAQLHGGRTTNGAGLLGRPSLKAAEQAIVNWAPDDQAKACHVCHEMFGPALLARKHHCRLCGCIVCHRDTCSVMYDLTPTGSPQLSAATRSGTGGASPRPPISQNGSPAVRVCRRCASLLNRRNFIVDAIRSKTHTLTAYQTIVRYRGNVEKLLPKFDDLVLKLSHQIDLTETNIDYQIAARLRKDLLENLSNLDRASKNITKLKADTPSDRRLHTAIYQYCAQYLQQRMFSLSLLPKLLHGRTPTSSQRSPSVASVPNSARSPVGRRPPRSLPSQLAGSADSASQPAPPLPSRSDTDTSAAAAGPEPPHGLARRASVVSSIFSLFGMSGADTNSEAGSSLSRNATVEDLSAELDKLDVLREQRFLVEGYLREAVQHRKLEDAKSLRASLADLEAEITRIEAVIPTI